jgi:hypothetical protein
LSFTFTTNIIGNVNFIRPVQPVTQPPFYNTYQTTSYQPVYQTQSTQASQETSRVPQTFTESTTKTSKENRNDNGECGISETRGNFTALVTSGNHAVRGQFPWLVAYFYSGDNQNKFICGGSLISAKLVITAAHCVQSKFSKSIRKAEDSTFYIGKTNIDSLIGESNYVTSNADQLIIHPDWNSATSQYDSDIAIAVLVKTIIYNKFIKPICIWRQSNSYRDMIGQHGIVAGWGKTEVNAISTASPMFASIPVVDGETCLLSDKRFSAIASKKTFCAGVKNLSQGPCNGDSGKKKLIFVSS